MLDLLIKSGGDVNKKSEDYPIIYATQVGNVKIAEYLLSKGANVNTQRVSDGYTPLMIALSERNQELVKIFLEKGADVNSVNVNAKSVLDFAITEKNTEIIELLKQHGAKTGAELKAENETKQEQKINK